MVELGGSYKRDYLEALWEKGQVFHLNIEYCGKQPAELRPYICREAKTHSEKDESKFNREEYGK